MSASVRQRGKAARAPRRTWRSFFTGEGLSHRTRIATYALTVATIFTVFVWGPFVARYGWCAVDGVQTTGRITGPPPTATRNHDNVAFAFQVDGQTYTGTGISNVAYPASNRPPGEVLVWYHAGDPSHACLGDPLVHLQSLLSAAAVFFLVGIVLLVSWAYRESQRKAAEKRHQPQSFRS